MPGQWCAARHLLRGRMIAFVHDGPSVVSQHFDEARIASALAHLQIFFVGSAGRQTRLGKRALAIPDLRLRAYALFNYLTIRHALHTPEGVSPPDLAAISQLVRRAVEDVASQARHVPEDTAEVHARPSDIANVRDVARSDEHAQRESTDADSDGPDDGNIFLDPVGVFAQSADATVGAIFSDLAKLVKKQQNSDDVGNTAPEQSQSSDGERENPAASDHEQEKSNKRRKCARTSVPLNEFTENSQLLYGAFWHLFPLRAGLRGDGPLTPAARRHIATQFHNAFAHSPQLLFLLADQVQRHAAAAQGVALRVKSKSFEAFATAVADGESCIARLEAAKASSMHKRTRWELLKSISRFVVLVG